MRMLSAVSAQIVHTLGRGNLYAVDGLPETMNIKLFTIVTETSPFCLNYWGTKEYGAYGYKISDITTGNTDALNRLRITDSPVKTFTVGSKCNASVEMSAAISEDFPSLMAKATTDANLYMTIKSGGFKLLTVDQPAFKAAIEQGKAKKDDDLIKASLDNSRNRLGVVIEVLKTIDGTVIEFFKKCDDDFVVSTKKPTGFVKAAMGNVSVASYTFDNGSVLAFRWQPLKLDKTTLRFGLDSQSSEKSKDIKSVRMRGSAKVTQEVVGDGAGEERQDSDRDGANRDRFLIELERANDENKLKEAVCTVMDSDSDGKALLSLFSNNGGKERTFTGQLNKSQAVWTLLEFVGYKQEGENIGITFKGKFPTLIPVLIESFSVIKSKEDREVIKQCNDYQREELLRIIEKTMENETSIPFGSKFKEELHKTPVERILAVMNFKIDYTTNKLSPPSKKTCVIEAMFYLLKFL